MRAAWGLEASLDILKQSSIMTINIMTAKYLQACHESMIVLSYDFLNIFFCYMCMSVCSAPETRRFQMSRNWTYRCLQASTGSWELNTTSLPEQHTLLTTERINSCAILVI